MRFVFVLAGLLLASAAVAAENALPPLLQATQDGRIEEVRKLIDGGIKVDMRDAEGYTAFLMAASSGHMEILEELLKRGADPKARATSGLNAMNWAAYSGHADVVRRLLELGLDVDSNQNNAGWSALMNASATGHEDVVRLLLERGAQVGLKDKEGWTALGNAVAKQHLDIARALLAKGADGTAELMFMVDQKNTTGIETLLAAGVEIDARNGKGETALYRASASHDATTARALLAHGANPNLYPSETSNMDTPLKWAAYYCDDGLARALLASGAAKTGHGDDAYDLARTGWTSDMKACSPELQELLRP